MTDYVKLITAQKAEKAVEWVVRRVKKAYKVKEVHKMKKAYKVKNWRVNKLKNKMSAILFILEWMKGERT